MCVLCVRTIRTVRTLRTPFVSTRAYAPGTFLLSHFKVHVNFCCVNFHNKTSSCCFMWYKWCKWAFGQNFIHAPPPPPPRAAGFCCLSQLYSRQTGFYSLRTVNSVSFLYLAEKFVKQLCPIYEKCLCF